jgi:hypothetical protein
LQQNCAKKAGLPLISLATLLGGLGWAGKLTHWQYDTFVATWTVPGRERNLVTFMLGPKGDVDILRVDGLADFAPVSISTAAEPK